MVLLLSMYGQRSNNLFQHVHIDSFCRDNNIRFYNKFIYDLRKDYPNVGKPNLVFDLLIKFKVLQILYKLKLIKYIDFNDKNQNIFYKAAIIKCNLLSCEGWFLWSNRTVAKYRKHYQYLFEPVVNKDLLRSKYLRKDIESISIIGVHVRRGDYIHHEGGKYFFNDAVYIDKMCQLVRLLGEDTQFIVFTNDEKMANLTYQSTFANVLFSNQTPIEDHFLMSQCDYLIGPPSTFNMWGSYMGNVPLYHIYESNAIIKLEDFEILHNNVNNSNSC